MYTVTVFTKCKDKKQWSYLDTEYAWQVFCLVQNAEDFAEVVLTDGLTGEVIAIADDLKVTIYEPDRL